MRPAYVPSWGRGFVGARPRQHRRCLRSAIRLALPGEPTMRRDSAGAATQTWAVCMRAAHAWACVLRNCISVCACVRHGPGARVPVRLSMPPASSSADSQEVQCVGGAPHPRAPLPSHGICPTQNHPFEFKFGFRQAPCQGMVPREHHWRRGPGRIQPPNCQSMRRSLRAAPAEVRGSRLSLNFNRVTRVTAAGPRDRDCQAEWALRGIGSRAGGRA